jgi:lipopolysaccharide biosynthesis protein
MSMGSMTRRLRSMVFHALRGAFRALPFSEAELDALRSWFLWRFPSIRPTPSQRQIPPDVKTRARAHSGGRAIGYVGRCDKPLPDPLPASLVAFYLPQFHAIPENDEWWGKGFTEWRNVARALPQFEGHAQPRLPGDLGFYDLRNPQVLRDQAELAQAYGISAFCVYFYWFGGKTLLEAPVQQWLDDDSITLPICLCWANENWTRRWDGRGDEILIEQHHGPEDDIAFIAHIAPYILDPRYLRVDGKPLLLVYRPIALPNARATAERWRKWCRQNGIGEIMIAYVQGFERPDPRKIGLDAAVEFPPNTSMPTNLTARQHLLNRDFRGEVLDWREVARDCSQRPMPDYRLFPGVNCGWDNEPRRPGLGRVYAHASPDRYRRWLSHTIAGRLATTPSAQRLVFINAWNEWAEGAVLEPDARLGHAWLRATRDALVDAAGTATEAPRRPCVVVHAWYPDAFEEILNALDRAGFQHRLVVTVPEDRADAVRAALIDHQREAEIEVSENRGRDVLPFLRVATRLRAEGEDVVLKLHTKRSPHMDGGERWRRELVHGLLGNAPTKLEAFAADASLGLLVVDAHYRSLAEAWGATGDMLAPLTARLGVRAPTASVDHFPAGTMFWARLDALAPLLDAHLDEAEFEAEAGQIDGTLAHAIERIIGVCVNAAGYRTDVRPGA